MDTSQLLTGHQSPSRPLKAPHGPSKPLTQLAAPPGGPRKPPRKPPLHIPPGGGGTNRIRSRCPRPLRRKKRPEVSSAAVSPRCDCVRPRTRVWGGPVRAPCGTIRVVSPPLSTLRWTRPPYIAGVPAIPHWLRQSPSASLGDFRKRSERAFDNLRKSSETFGELWRASRNSHDFPIPKKRSGQTDPKIPSIIRKIEVFGFFWIFSPGFI